MGLYGMSAYGTGRPPTLAYYAGERVDLLPYLGTLRGKSVLDVGCGAGGLAPHLRSLGAVEIVGIEPSALAVEAGVRCDNVYRLPVEKAVGEIDRQFDVIVAADVLEHLVDPWTVLAHLRPLLAKEGMLLVSIPNVANLRILLRLAFRRDWRFDESGLFDRTHLRWFGRDSLRQMLVGAGFEPQVWGANAGLLLGGWRWERSISPRGLRFLPSYLVEQWIVVCHATDLISVSTDL